MFGVISVDICLHCKSNEICWVELCSVRSTLQYYLPPSLFKVFFLYT